MDRGRDWGTTSPCPEGPVRGGGPAGKRRAPGGYGGLVPHRVFLSNTTLSMLMAYLSLIITSQSLSRCLNPCSDRSISPCPPPLLLLFSCNTPVVDFLRQEAGLLA